jgi:HK97 family phage portal protein
VSLGSRLRALFGRESKSASTLELLTQIYGGTHALTGDTINWKTALQVSTVLGCTRAIANGISQVPFKLFQESKDGRSRVPAKDHPLFRVLHSRPNPWQSSFEYRQTLAFHLVLVGNHYSFKNVVNGQVVELIPFEPGCVGVERQGNGELLYRVTYGGGQQQVFPAASIWHLRGPSWNGWSGMEAVQLARESIGLALATERQHAKLHANGVSTSGTYSVEGTLNTEQYHLLRKFIADNHSGMNSGLPMLLDRNAKWMSQAMSGVDAQHLETRRLQVEEVCRAMGVFPQMVGHTDKTATFASAEAFFIAHVVHTLAPWYECIEQSVNNNLLTDKDYRNGVYAKFVEEGLLRGSMEATAAMLEKYVNGGLMTPNEGREKLDMNPDSDPKSDQLRIPANIVGKQAAEPLPAKSLRMDVLEDRLEALALQARQPMTLTLNQEPVEAHFHAAPVNNNINMPEITFPELKSAPIQVDVHNNVPEQPAQVPANVQIDVHVPEQAAPVVQNNVTLPEQPAAINTFEVTLPELNVTAKLPPRKSKSKTEITRNASGDIVRSLSESTETDA